MRREGGLMVIGAAIGDVTVMPAPKNLPAAGSTPMERIRLSTGGDALNEAIVAARLGCRTTLVTLLGRDDMASVIRSHCDREGVRLLAAEDPRTDTGLNVVLVDETGERRFLTNANGTLRRLSLEHILPALETEEYAAARAVCLASLFVSPALTLADTQTLFRRIKADGKLLCADTTRPKHGETIADAAGALKHLDWFFPNLEEALLLTRADSPRAAAEALLSAGVRHVALKLGGEGCLLASRETDFGEGIAVSPEHLRASTNDRRGECGCAAAPTPARDCAARSAANGAVSLDALSRTESAPDACAPSMAASAPDSPFHFRIVPAVPGVRCVDATGAGDTFAASFQCALLAGDPPVRCAAYANAAASLCVEQPGATSAALDPDEIARRSDAVLARL